MRRTELLQELRKMRFEEAYDGWSAGRLTQGEAAFCWGFASGRFVAIWCVMKPRGLRG
jgi:hypothetical protein